MRLLVLPGDGIGPEITDALHEPATRITDLGGKLGTRAFARHVSGLVGSAISA
jgi:isocitrate/isopropylmalate dehydrogenase